LGAPDQSYYDIILGALRDIKNQDFHSAEAKLMPVQDRFWAMSMLALSQLGISRASMHPKIASITVDSGIATLQQLAEKAPDAYVGVWAKEWLARAYRDKKDYSTAIHYYEDLASKPYGIYVRNAKTELGLLYHHIGNKSQAVNMFKEEIAEFDIKGYDDPNFMKSAILESGSFDLAVELQEKIIYSNADNSEKQKARVEIARIYFHKGDYERAKQLAEELVNSNADPKTELKANMILLSIEWKKIFNERGIK